MNKIQFICALFLCICVCSCKYNVFNLSEEEEIVCKLPEWPPESYKADDTKGEGFSTSQSSPYPAISRWQVQIVAGDLKSADTMSECSVFYTTESEFSITVTKNMPVAVSVRPITLTTDGSEVSFFKPAGFIYPYEQEFTWEGGVSVQIFQTLFNSKKETGVTTEHMIRFLESFNWKKLTELINKNINTSVEDFYNPECKSPKFYNPWQIDFYALLDNLGYGNFKTNLLNTKNIYEVSLQKLDLGLENNIQVLSSFIPENQIISATGKISLKKGQVDYFCCNTDFAAIITYFSSKNISKEMIFMPIIQK